MQWKIGLGGQGFRSPGREVELLKSEVEWIILLNPVRAGTDFFKTGFQD
jgi:hypothetical protein